MKKFWIECVMVDNAPQLQVSEMSAGNQLTLCNPKKSKEILDALFANKKTGDKLSKAKAINHEKQQDKDKKERSSQEILDPADGSLFHKITVGEEECGVALRNGIVFRGENEFDIIINSNLEDTTNKKDHKKEAHGPAFLGGGANGLVKSSAVTCKLENDEWKVSSSDTVYKIISVKSSTDVEAELKNVKNEANSMEMVYGEGSVGAPFVSHGKIYLPMIRIPGNSLEGLVAAEFTNKKLTVAQKIIWSLKLLQFCEFMQKQGVGYHGDLAPRNIKVTFNPSNPADVNFYVLDFGYSADTTSESIIAQGTLLTTGPTGLFSKELFTSIRKKGNLTDEERAVLDQNKTDVIGAGMVIAAIFTGDERLEVTRNKNLRKNSKFDFSNSFKGIGVTDEIFQRDVLDNLLCDDPNKRFSFEQSIAAVKSFCLENMETWDLNQETQEILNNITNESYNLSLKEVQQQLKAANKNFHFTVDLGDTVKKRDWNDYYDAIINPPTSTIEKISELWKALCDYFHITFSPINYRSFKDGIAEFKDYYDKQSTLQPGDKITLSADANKCVTSEKCDELSTLLKEDFSVEKTVDKEQLNQLNSFVNALTPLPETKLSTHYAHTAAYLEYLIDSNPDMLNNLKNFITLVNCVEKNDDIKAQYKSLYPEGWNNFKLVASELQYLSCAKNILGDNLKSAFDFNAKTSDFCFKAESVAKSPDTGENTDYQPIRAPSFLT